MKFLKTLLASLLGTLLAFLFLFLVLFIVISSTSTDPEPYIRSNTVLEIELKGNIPARTVTTPFDDIFQPGSRAPSLENLRSNLKKAASDDRIAGVWIQTNFVTASWANLESVYGYLLEYKESGKFLYFSTDDIGMNEKAYFLATTADSVFSPEETMFEFDGFFAQLAFYKGTMEKLGIEPEIIRVGKYKSAIEPFIQAESSPESREQITAILNSVSNRFIEAVNLKTGKPVEEINNLMNQPPDRSVYTAFENGLIDVLAYPDQVETHIKRRIGLEEDDDLKMVNLNRYNRVEAKSAGLEKADTKNKIAVIYSSGAILPDAPQSPFDQQSVITASSIRKQLDDIKKDDNIKAIVVHIESPGGSASTSDLIWHYLRETEIPVVAVMGSVAASGGYYIAAGADTIVADANTITGSIGVFSLLVNTQDFYNEKLGITFDTIKTHEHADIFTLTRPLSPSEKRALERGIDKTYETFLNRVADARGLTRDEVHNIAQGRVWTGEDAKEQNLVDVIGNLDSGLEIAAEMAGIEEYRVEIFPKKKDFMATLLGSADSQVKSWIQSMIPFHETINELEFIMKQPVAHTWAYLPFYVVVE
ncbi:MAG: signal peptide peptidase SppA [Balneolaceae bacterium]